jgi:hypothetical protein
MTRTVELLLPSRVFDRLNSHLFPGDGDEHAAVIMAGMVNRDRGARLLARELLIPKEGTDYRVGARGYKALQPSFIHRAITRCRDERLVYLAVHNHGGRGSVAFSAVDMASHERGYPALLDIAEGMPVGALVVADGAMEVDLWSPDGHRSNLREARVLGRSAQYIYSNGHVRDAAGISSASIQDPFGRQILMFGEMGQAILRRARVAVIGVGGIGALVSEYLSRLGVGTLVLIDPDRIEISNLSRVVGARLSDLKDNDGRGRLKVDIASELAGYGPAPPQIVSLPRDVADESVAMQLRDVDFAFLAADSMRSRLVFNALVHQYFVPGIQLGSKVRADAATGSLDQSFSVVRSILPGDGCLLCNGLIDNVALAKEWHSEEERRQADYGTTLPNPSVITMNAVAAAHGVNEFLFFYLGLRSPSDKPLYLRFDHLSGKTAYDEPRRDSTCTECSPIDGSRFGRGDAVRLPCGVG